MTLHGLVMNWRIKSHALENTSGPFFNVGFINWSLFIRRIKTNLSLDFLIEHLSVKKITRGEGNLN